VIDQPQGVILKIEEKTPTEVEKENLVAGTKLSALLVAR
jgi:hypothetical protein